MANDKVKLITSAQGRILDSMFSGGCRHTGRGGHPVPAMRALERLGLVLMGTQHVWETDWKLTVEGLAIARHRAVQAKAALAAASESARPVAPKVDGPVLYTSSQVEPAERRAQLSRDVLSVLRSCYGLAIWGTFPNRDGTVYVQTGFHGGYDLWSVTDNGGEFCVSKVNHEVATQRDVPYVDRDGVVDAGTVGYRIATTIQGDVNDIDWNARHPDLVEPAGEVEARRG